MTMVPPSSSENRPLQWGASRCQRSSSGCSRVPLQAPRTGVRQSSLEAERRGPQQPEGEAAAASGPNNRIFSGAAPRFTSKSYRQLSCQEWMPWTVAVIHWRCVSLQYCTRSPKAKARARGAPSLLGEGALKRKCCGDWVLARR